MSVAEYLDQHPEWIGGDPHMRIRLKLPTGETPLLRNESCVNATGEFWEALKGVEFIRLEYL